MYGMRLLSLSISSTTASLKLPLTTSMPAEKNLKIDSPAVEDASLEFKYMFFRLK